METSNSPKLRIGYGIVLYNTANSGVYKKISDQVLKWIELGANPHLFVITDQASIESWKQIGCDITIFVDTNLVTKVRNRFRLLLSTRKTPVDILYVRDVFPLFYPKLKIPIVVEIQTFYAKELSLRKKSVVPVYKIVAKLMHRQLNAAVYVTNELLNLNETSLGAKVMKIVIGNGIKLSRVQRLGENNSKKLSLFFVGHPDQPWHGVDQMIEFVGVYPQIHLHLVGYELGDSASNVSSYGVLDESSYVELARTCVAGVATLNLGSKGMKEASPLKSREYLAMGLPVIARYSDPDFTPAPNYILELPQNGASLQPHSEEILTFLRFWSEKRVPRDSIAHIDVQSKETQRLDFFQEVLRRYRNNYKKTGSNESHN